MVRRHGWAGDPPADEHEARDRIIAAAMQRIDEHGPDSSTLADVAVTLGVTRQTIYRYYPSTDELYVAVARTAVDSYLEELVVPLREVTDPAEWVVETLALAIELLPTERYLTLLLVTGRAERFTAATTSAFSRSIGRELLKRSSVDWVAEGYEDTELDELVELMLRMLQSMTTDPPTPQRTGTDLRRYFRRWLSPGPT